MVATGIYNGCLLGRLVARYLAVFVFDLRKSKNMQGNPRKSKSINEIAGVEQEPVSEGRQLVMLPTSKDQEMVFGSLLNLHLIQV